MGSRVRKKAYAFSNFAFFIGLAILSFFNTWWPELMLVLAVTLGLRFGIQRKLFMSICSMTITVGFYLSAKFSNYLSELKIPPITLLFILLGIIVLARGLTIKEEKEERPEGEEIEIKIDDEKK